MDVRVQGYREFMPYRPKVAQKNQILRIIILFCQPLEAPIKYRAGHRASRMLQQGIGT